MKYQARIDGRLLRIGPRLSIPLVEMQWRAIRAQSAGGQNVNKVASAVHLRFPVADSSLPAAIKARLLGRKDRRLTEDGVFVVKSQQHRTQERNRQAALQRFADWIATGAVAPKARKATKPSRSAKRRRMDDKKQRGVLKSSRRRPSDD